MRAGVAARPYTEVLIPVGNGHARRRILARHIDDKRARLTGFR